MVKKILLGLLQGAFSGGIVFFALSALHVAWTAMVTYLAVALVGAIVGAISGRPVWAREAKLEALLKSLAGAFIASIAMYGTRKWLAGVHVNLELIGSTSGPLGEVPLAALPVIGAALGFVFQIDDALGSEDKTPEPRLRASEPSEGEAEHEAEEESSERRARRQG
jgi:ABC-type xylose transport system permease subunit